LQLIGVERGTPERHLCAAAQIATEQLAQNVATLRMSWLDHLQLIAALIRRSPDLHRDLPIAEAMAHLTGARVEQGRDVALEFACLE
jgi:hypothetical protein